MISNLKARLNLYFDKLPFMIFTFMAAFICKTVHCFVFLFVTCFDYYHQIAVTGATHAVHLSRPSSLPNFSLRYASKLCCLMFSLSLFASALAFISPPPHHPRPTRLHTLLKQQHNQVCYIDRRKGGIEIQETNTIIVPSSI